MNSNLALIQWTKKNFPEVLRAAVMHVQRKVALGGLGDDLLSEITFDPSSVSASDSIDYAQTDPGYGTSYNPASAPAASTDWSGIIDSVANAIPKVAGGVIQTKAAWDLINTNSQLAQQGRPLVNSLSNPNVLGQNSTLILGGLAILGIALVAGGRNRKG